MCLTPIHLRTNAKYITLNGYKRYYMDVPCGKCAECQQMKKNEWFVRNYYEAKMTWLNDGYILFDTLTFSDDHLPSVSSHVFGKDCEDMTILEYLDWQVEHHDESDLRDLIRNAKDNNYSCFNYHQVQNFFKLLRIRLQRSGFDVKRNLRYFLASEYGHDQCYVDNYGRTRKGTNRPHYHVLFYVQDGSLDPLLLSQMVADAWIYGRTDGFPYKGRSYVLNNVFGPRYIKDPNRLTGVQYYTTKYVCKDYEFAESIDVRISHVLRDIYHVNYSSDSYSERRRELHRYMDQFHRQSIGFGLFALSDPENVKSIWSDSALYLPDKQKVVKRFSVPMYYIRKMFQKCVKDLEGSLRWVWTELGVQYRTSCVGRTISVLSQKMKDWYDNLSTYLSASPMFGNNINIYRQRIDSILDGRSFDDYARYVVLYKGRLCRDKFDLDSPDVIVRNSLMDPLECGLDYLQEQTPGVYKFGDFYLDDYLLRDNCLIDEYSSDEFQGFDRLFGMYQVTMAAWNRQVQKTYEFKLEYQKRMKANGFKCTKKI